EPIDRNGPASARRLLPTGHARPIAGRRPGRNPAAAGLPALAGDPARYEPTGVARTLARARRALGLARDRRAAAVRHSRRAPRQAAADAATTPCRSSGRGLTRQQGPARSSLSGGLPDTSRGV